MTLFLPQSTVSPAFRGEVAERSGQDPASCYQCGKCTAGCPSAADMDYPPHQVMRGVQLGLRDTVLQSRAIWLCAACETCSTRCPQSVDVAAVMDALRQMAMSPATGVRTPEKDIPLFHRIFLGSIKQHGRIFEVTMMGLYNVLSGHYLKDVAMAPGMLAKGKLGLLPPRIGNARSLRRMFNRAGALEARRE